LRTKPRGTKLKRRLLLMKKSQTRIYNLTK
jgi:hypothetical protein